MRLTLRTMLAYMDEILEPHDAEVIGKKIEESEFATGLLHRTRDVMRRLRLGTPDVKDRGAGLDPNTVAEYLDNSLADDRVLDFEKICLESDVHLAEVASCHQILALVLGEPAEVDPGSRQRMYQLPRLVDAQLKAPTEASDVPAATSATESRPDVVERGAQTATQPPHLKPGVPEWLRQEKQGRRRWWPAAATVVLALACGVFMLATTGQLGPGSFLGDLLGLGQAGKSVVRTPGPAEVDDELPQQGPGDGAGSAEAEPSEAGLPAAEREGHDLPVPASPSAAPPTQATRSPGWADEPLPLTIPPDTIRRVDGPGQPAPPDERAIQGAGQPAEPQPEATAPTAAGPTTPPLTQPPIADITVTMRDSVTQPGDQPKAEPRARPGTQPSAAPAPFPPEPVGQLDAPTQILLVFDADAGTWQRLPEQATLLSQTNYLSLPTYRPMLRLADQTELRLIDGTEIELLPTDQEGVSGVRVEYGRLVIETPEAAGDRLRLEVGDRSGMITFADAGSRLAVEVSRAPNSGADPETQPSPLTTDLYAISGRILWQERTGREPVAVNAPLRLTLNDQPLEAVAVARFPKWIVDPTVSLLDQRASSTVERELAVGRPAVLGLRELADHRRKEVRWLALRCLDCVGDFGLMVAALDNPEEKAAWPDYVERLRAAVARGPVAAAQIRTAMEKLHGGEGAVLYEMLWKYGDEVLDADEAAHLVEYLDHTTLAFRVVSFQTLKSITKLGLNYRPEDPPAKRQPWIEKWKERLRSSPLPEADTPKGEQPPAEGDASPAKVVLPGTND